MASAGSSILVVMFMVAVRVIPSTATDYLVGDDQGWTTGFDYQAWAAGKEFHAGDKLIFKYKKGNHNVHRVDGTAFEVCATSTDNEPLTSGNDAVTLITPGTKWYICGVGNHCESGNQKLTINVTAADSTIPLSADAPFHLRPRTYLGIMITAFGLLYSYILI